MKRIHLIACLLAGAASGFAQTILPLNDLSAFKNPSKTWSVVASVQGSPQAETLQPSPGTGVLLNTKPSTPYSPQDNLFTLMEHGDLRLSLDFMMPKGSNSGVYLMGRYEVQLFDSWQVKNLLVKDCGSIYERWDDSRPEGRKGYEGHVPRQNVSRAPGLWQHLDVEFQAPAFDAAGRKIRNARFVKVVLNGVIIHENIDVSGPTRAAAFGDERPKGPLMLQGDHGSVAFRNISYESFDKAPVGIDGKMNYQYFEGNFGTKVPETLPTNALSQGLSDKLNYRLADKNQNFLLHFTGKLNVPDTDTYRVWFHVRGHGALSIDGQPVFSNYSGWNRSEAKTIEVKLSAGTHTLAVSYTKDVSWGGRELGVWLSRTGMRPVALHEYTSLPNPEPVGDIVVAPSQETTLQRSFVMFNGKKKTHAISVGSPSGIHYTYDLNQGAILYGWKGDFLNATEMWHERGEPQTAAPAGSALLLTGKCPLAWLTSEAQMYPDTLNDEKDWMYKGYVIDKQRNAAPTFSYQYQKVTLQDRINPSEQGLSRTLELMAPTNTPQCYARLAEGTDIRALGGGLYLVNNGDYYLQTNAPTLIKEQNGQKLLLSAIPLSNGKGGLNYTIIW